MDTISYSIKVSGSFEIPVTREVIFASKAQEAGGRRAIAKNNVPLPREFRKSQVRLIAVIRFYRFAIRGLLGSCCRFEPSCSTYAMDAITKHGCLKGCYLTLWRILRCHPWHPGGLDPVPDARSLQHQETRSADHKPIRSRLC